jgi:hypothetical protein
MRWQYGIATKGREGVIGVVGHVKHWVLSDDGTHNLPVRVRGPFAAFPETYLALGSIAAPATATAFLLGSLSKMPRSIPSTLRILPRGISDQG